MVSREDVVLIYHFGVQTVQGKLKEKETQLRGLQKQIATYEKAQEESNAEIQQLRDQV